ncbi:hypothetical protein CSQ88_19050 [Iodobacter sp. BJB302]|nr:hypothetical protein CSQ88_19050 [Iodobacter sp. BJB302]
MSREIKLNTEQQKVVKGESCLAARLRGWCNSLVSRGEHRAEDTSQPCATKRDFFAALERSEGKDNAQKAIIKAGLPENWSTNNKPLTSRQISKVLDSAQAIREVWTRSIEKEVRGLMPKDVSKSYERDLETKMWLSLKGADYTSGITAKGAAEELLVEAKKQVKENMAHLCKERFPHLSEAFNEVTTNGSICLDASTLPQTMREAYAIEHSSIKGKVLSAFEETTKLLGAEAWDQQSLQTLHENLKEHCKSLSELQSEVSTEDAIEDGVLGALKQDLPRQIELIEAKQHYVLSLSEQNPLSMRALAQSDLLWAKTVEQLLLDVKPNLSENDSKKLDGVTTKWPEVVAAKAKQLSDSSEKEIKPQQLDAPNKQNKKTHPVALGKQGVLSDLRGELESAGFSKKQIKSMMSTSQLKLAQTKVLSRSPEWVTIDRNMVVVRNGAVSNYRSVITPVQHWDARFKDTYTVDGQMRGVTAGEAGNHDHARNLKVSQLFNSAEQPMMTVVGHGVLDMWEITDSAERQNANTAGAKEVLELALASNPRLKLAAINGDKTRLTHVSVNLISPDTLRSTGLFKRLMPAYAEKDFTQAQFDAFKANSGATQTLQLRDGDSNKEVKVDVDTITFSFGINSIATTAKLSLGMLGVWRNVHAHNRSNMIKLVGDLGQGTFGARSALPGGFIGEVYDRLKAKAESDPSLQEKYKAQMLALRAQTDTVRQMFTERSFESGRGDTAKMGREILMLQGLAERALVSVEANDLAATMSKGCKSDKDRGGVTDVELKTKFILQDLGGNLKPDARLVGDDQLVYNMVSASSGQLENQRANTGLGGSKEAGHLKERLPDPKFRDYLMGLGMFAAA